MIPTMAAGGAGRAPSSRAAPAPAQTSIITAEAITPRRPSAGSDAATTTKSVRPSTPIQAAG
jgi:hypothetical protein